MASKWTACGGFSCLPLWPSCFLEVFRRLLALREARQGLGLNRGVRTSRQWSWPGLGRQELTEKVSKKLTGNPQNNKVSEFFFLPLQLRRRISCQGRFRYGQDRSPVEFFFLGFTPLDLEHKCSPVSLRRQSPLFWLLFYALGPVTAAGGRKGRGSLCSCSEFLKGGCVRI